MEVIYKFKNIINSFKNKNQSIYRVLYYIILRVYLLLKLIFVRRYRAKKFTKLIYKNKLHQSSIFTQNNRYPFLFNTCKNLFEKIKEPHILSFGCSTGEEVNSIRNYISSAHLYGVDINNYCIKQCKRKYSHENNIFTHPNSLIYKGINQLDAIFCLAVFQDSKNRHDEQIVKSKQYLFNQFQSQLMELDSMLKIGGLLFIDHSDFNFLETVISSDYKILDINNNRITRKRPLFNKYNEKVSNQSTLFRIFIKIQ